MTKFQIPSIADHLMDVTSTGPGRRDDPDEVTGVEIDHEEFKNMPLRSFTRGSLRRGIVRLTRGS